MSGLRRGLAGIALAALPLGCAHVEAPPGGPEDKAPPQLVALQPDSLQVVAPFRGPLVLTFDERLSERGINDRSVWVSPRTSGVRVDHSGSRLRVSLRGGWEPDRIYHVTVLPGLVDLFSNRRTEAITTVFSTGPEIPDSWLTVTVVDRLTGRPAVGVRAEAITADSLVYALPTDSAGVARFRRIPLSEYVVRAYNDANRNRALDAFEVQDLGTVRVAGADSVGLHLSIVAPDSTPPRLATVRVTGENLEARFDDHLDPEPPLTAGQVQLVGPDGTHVAVAQVGVGALPRADTLAGGQDRAQPQASAPVPSQTLLIRPAAALQPGLEYRLRIQRVRNVVGLEADVEGTVRVPETARQERPGESAQPTDTAATSGATIPTRR